MSLKTSTASAENPAGPVLGGQSAVAVKDGDRVGLIVRGKALQLIEGLHRLGLAGQVVGGVVLLGVLELARQWADYEQDNQPHRDHRELGPLAAREQGGGACD